MYQRTTIHLTCLVLLLGLIPANWVEADEAGLVGWWRFEEGAGDVIADSSGNGHDGAVLGTPLWGDGPTGFGGALNFKDTRGANCGNFDPTGGTGVFTLTLWCLWDGTTGTQHFLTKSNGWGADTMMFQVEVKGGNSNTARTDRFALAYQGATQAIFHEVPKNEWAHMALVFDGTDATGYLNGVDETGPQPTGIGAYIDGPVWIGVAFNDARVFQGYLDDMRLYDHAKGPEEISGIMVSADGGYAYAAGPSPKDGTMIDTPFSVLTWRPGDFAALHDVYFGENREAVGAAGPDDADVYVGRQATAQVVAGMPGGTYPEGLVPGTTYYWRVDEVNDTEPNSPWRGDVWSFRVHPVIAFEPFPVDGMKYVDPDQDLTWQDGTGVIFHTVYFGQSADEVSVATADGWMSLSSPYDPGPLALDTTYYWRVDEFAGITTHTGDIWSFTTRGEGGGVKAEYFSGTGLAGDPELTQTEGSIDHTWGNAEVVAGLEDNVSARWTATLEAPLTETFQFITTSDDGVRLWLDGRLLIDNWTDHSATDNTASVDLIAGQFYALRLEYYDSAGDAVAQLSWESPSIPRQIIPQGWLQLPLRAGSPSPAHLEPHAPQAASLCWSPGDEATGHHVYFGVDSEVVGNADTASNLYQGRQAASATCYDPTTLEWGRTYCWRVDETYADGTVLKGPVWAFTTADFLPVEDFESYDDDIEGGTAIFQTWIDGVENGSASYVGYEIADGGSFGELKVVHGGYQSMPLAYDNTVAPFYSEADRTWTPSQNWTVNGVDGLTLFVRGRAGNDPEGLYVAIEDSSGRVAVAVAPDPAMVTKGVWTEWTIPLSEFSGAGVNLAAVKKMVIGLGDRDAPTPGGAGTIFVDDIRVTRSAPVE